MHPDSFTADASGTAAIEGTNVSGLLYQHTLVIIIIFLSILSGLLFVVLLFTIILFKRTIRDLKLVKSKNPNRIPNIEEGNLAPDDHTLKANLSDSANSNVNAGIPSTTTTAVETAEKRALPSTKVLRAFEQLISPLTPTFWHLELAPAPSYTSQPLSGETTLGWLSPMTPGFGQGTGTGRRMTPSIVQTQTRVVSPLTPPASTVDCDSHCPTCPLAGSQSIIATAATVLNPTNSPNSDTSAKIAALWLPKSSSSSNPSQYLSIQPGPSDSCLVAPTQAHWQLEPVPEHWRTIRHMTSLDSIEISEQDSEDDPEHYPHSHPRPLPHPPHGFAPTSSSRDSEAVQTPN